jgi:hypothetical protein
MHTSFLRLLACATAVATVFLGAVGFAAAPARASEPAPAAQPVAGYPPYPSSLIVKSELRLKANLIRDNLAKSPQLVFFGGSRSQRFDPAFARRTTGLRSVNIATSCARPEAAWGMLNWFYSRWPDAKVRWVWGMQSGMLRDLDLDPALLQDPRFYPYFPDDVLAGQRAQLPQTVGDMPHSYGFLRNKYSDLGMCLWNVYDTRFAKGLTLDESLDTYIARMLHESLRAEAGTEVPESQARTYFEKTVKLLNEHGTSPIIVLMPIHPRVLRVMRAHDMGGEREKLREYLAALGQTAQIKVLDLTTITSFNGRADWFYDGVHITRGNANRVILTVKRKAGDYLK